MFAKNIFFGEEAFFTPSYNMITHGSFDTKIARYIVVSKFGALCSVFPNWVTFAG